MKKLRNKKTGEIGEIRYENHALYIDTDEGFTYWIRTLAKLDEEWEDYNPDEPLIEHEIVRKAVRAWAEANDYGKDEEYQYEDFSIGCKSWALEHHQNGDDNEIHFNGGIDFRKMNHQGYYTITELCGEEED